MFAKLPQQYYKIINILCVERDFTKAYFNEDCLYKLIKGIIIGLLEMPPDTRAQANMIRSNKLVL